MIYKKIAMVCVLILLIVLSVSGCSSRDSIVIVHQPPVTTDSLEMQVCNELKNLDYDSCPERPGIGIGNCEGFLAEQIMERYDITFEQLDNISIKCFRSPDFTIIT